MIQYKVKNKYQTNKTVNFINLIYLYSRLMVEIFVDIESELSESINFAIEVFLNLKIFFNPCKNHKPKQKWYSSLTSFELQYIHFLSSIGHFFIISTRFES